MRATTNAGIAMREPTIMPAPKVDAEMPAFPSVSSVALERPKRANQGMFSENSPTRYPGPIPRHTPQLHTTTKNAGKPVPANKKADRKIHESRRNPSKRTKDQNRYCG